MPCRCDHKTENDSNSRDEERSSKYSFVSALCMSGGEGDNSYSTNSLLQVFPYLYSLQIQNLIVYVGVHSKTKTKIM